MAALIIGIWSVKTGEKITTFQDMPGAVHGIAWSPDDKILASCSRSSVVKFWDITTRKALRTFNGNKAGTYCIAWSPNGKIIACGGCERMNMENCLIGGVTLWDRETGTVVRNLSAQTKEVRGLSWSPDGKTLASGAENEVMMWDVSDLSAG